MLQFGLALQPGTKTLLLNWCSGACSPWPPQVAREGVNPVFGPKKTSRALSDEFWRHPYHIAIYYVFNTLRCTFVSQGEPMAPVPVTKFPQICWVAAQAPKRSPKSPKVGPGMPKWCPKLSQGCQNGNQGMPKRCQHRPQIGQWKPKSHKQLPMGGLTPQYLATQIAVIVIVASIL